MLLLKKRRERGRIQDADARIAIGEALCSIASAAMAAGISETRTSTARICGRTVPTTAFALMALQDRPAHTVVQKSRAEMRTDLKTEHSVLALSLAVICGRASGDNTAGLEDDLIAQYHQAGAMAERDILASAVMACALSADRATIFALERGASHA